MKKLIAAALFTALGAMLAAGPASAGMLKKPTGRVILTIAGNVANTNRPPYDEHRDGFIKYHEHKFKKAAEFDAAMLDSFGVHTVTIAFPKWGPKPFTFSGPRLADVLKAAGWDGKSITTLALDGFGTKISKADLAAHDWILATRVNGHPPGIGQKGPLWLVFGLPGNRQATDKEEEQWPWALFYIQAE